MSVSENAIDLRNVRKCYKGFELKNINLSLPKGTILGLVGENGAGKTTIIKRIMNVISGDGGDICVLGEQNDSPKFQAVKEEIGVVLDEAYFPEVLTAKQVGVVMKHTYRRWDGDCYSCFLQKLDLPPNKPFKDYSRGMKMKLAIAVALSHQPKLLLLDEATSGLDPMVRDEILEIFNDFTRDESHSILISSHIVSDLEKICDYIAFLQKGELVLCEEKDRLLEAYGIARMTQEELNQLPPEAVAGKKSNPYGVEALVRKDRIPASIQTERTTLETIILFLAKGGERA
ncbi:MAG: ABC transporter ATP-binding protein [Eubacteriales bacterium]|nr:ABC transporter ATP-binding protein [Eubacteriales bacterium]